MSATRYAMALSNEDGQELVVLYDILGGRRLKIARHGAAITSYTVRVGDALHELAEGYRSGAEIAARPGSRFAIMAPFAGRIAGGRYTFDGRAQDLQPGVADAQRDVKHGFVRDTAFDVIASRADDAQATMSFATAAIRPRPGYPHAIDLAVRYTLDAGGLTLEAVMRNVGESAAPCCFGWHPYFRVGGDDIDGWELAIPAQTLIRTGADMIPLPGAAAFLPVDEAPALDYREWCPIGEAILDQGYTDLQADADGRVRTRLRNPANGLGIAVWQDSGVMHVFTGDTLAQRARTAVALEPMECMADAFNRPECADAIRLEPGAERVFRCGVELDAAR